MHIAELYRNFFFSLIFTLSLGWQAEGFSLCFVLYLYLLFLSKESLTSRTLFSKTGIFSDFEIVTLNVKLASVICKTNNAKKSTNIP